jgi:hypothetical protein
MPGLCTARSVDVIRDNTLRISVLNMTLKPGELIQNQKIGSVNILKIGKSVPQSTVSNSPSKSYDESSDESNASHEECDASFNNLTSSPYSDRLNHGKLLRMIDPKTNATWNFNKLSINQVKNMNKYSNNSKTAIKSVKKYNSDAFIQENLKLITKRIQGLKMGLKQDSTQAKQLQTLIYNNRDLFSCNEYDLGVTGVTEHQIDTGHATPIKQQPYKAPASLRSEMERQIDSMKRKGIIKDSNSLWASPVIMVKKKSGEWRFCVDYRRLNSVKIKDSYPLTRMDETIQVLSGARFFSVVDLASGYWQVKVKSSDQPKTAFVTNSGLYLFTVMSFGLTNAPATFQRCLNQVLKGPTWKQCLVYLDDVIIFSKTFDKHLQRLQNVFDRLREFNLKIQPDKYSFAQEKVNYLGHELSSKGCLPDSSKVQATSNLKS